MNPCDGISQAINVNCDYPLVAGVHDEMFVMNFGDIDSVTRNGTNAQIIEGLTLGSGKLAYRYEGKNQSIEPRSALVKGRYSEVYDHEVIFKVFDNSPTIKQELEALSKVKCVIIVRNNHEGATGDGAYEIYGLDTGLELQELERVLGDQDTQGAYNLTARSSENAREPHLPSTFFITSLAVTKTTVEALLV